MFVSSELNTVVMLICSKEVGGDNMEIDMMQTKSDLQSLGLYGQNFG